MNSAKYFKNYFSKEFIYFTKFISAFLALFIISCAGTAPVNKNKEIIIYGKAEIKGDTIGVTPQKFDAALLLTAKLSGKYDYISLTDVQNQFREESKEQININEIASDLNADYIAVAQINTLKNIIRTQITINNVKNPSHRLSGVGYSEVNYIDAGSGAAVYDPSLLKSVQRAFALALNDSDMFVNPTLGLNVKPLPTLVIGSVAFTGENDDWDLWLDKVVSSYAAVETIFDIAKHSSDYVLYDTETRDTVYNIFGFHIVENYSPPSFHEIRALYQMAVDYYVAGSLTKTDNGAEIILSLFSIEKDGLKLIKSEKEEFTDDSRMVFLEHISRASKRLFGSM